MIFYVNVQSMACMFLQVFPCYTCFILFAHGLQRCWLHGYTEKSPSPDTQLLQGTSVAVLVVLGMVWRQQLVCKHSYGNPLLSHVEMINHGGFSWIFHTYLGLHEENFLVTTSIIHYYESKYLLRFISRVK